MLLGVTDCQEDPLHKYAVDSFLGLWGNRRVGDNSVVFLYRFLN